jgi:hypothetical protein
MRTIHHENIPRLAVPMSDAVRVRSLPCIRNFSSLIEHSLSGQWLAVNQVLEHAAR